MKLCIAEKPSVARDIAKVIGAKITRNGFIEGNGYFVTWVFGHLCSLKDPEDYNSNWKYWKLEDLPILPNRYSIKLKSDKGVEKQFQIICTLLSQSKEVINCGDAGQEGELIQRWLLLKAKCQIPVKRLWISSLTDDAIKKGFENLKDSDNFDKLFLAGNSRAIGDWMLGINGTRVYTKKFSKDRMILSVGRVQTPTLAMIVKRHEEIQSFNVEEFWELKTIYRDTEFTCQIPRLKSKKRSEQGLEYIKNKSFVVKDIEQKMVNEGNPKLYDLTSLQVDANKYFSNSADETLKIAQSLYEKKLISYPRVDTNYLSDDLYSKIEGILKQLNDYQKFVDPLLRKKIPKSKQVFDNSKITDHHAIIPTGVEKSALRIAERKIYELIVRRFISAFYPVSQSSNTIVTGKVEELEFKASGKQQTKEGWKFVYGDFYTNENKKNSEKKNPMPIFVINEFGPHHPIIHHGKTSPPKPYTEATLLRAMETAGKFVEDDSLKEMLKENGIGRPSTRANIIETLFKRKYIEKKKKNLFPTETGIHLIQTIKNDLLKSPELTGQWEFKLRQIEKGTYSSRKFISELSLMVKSIVDEVIFNKTTIQQ